MKHYKRIIILCSLLSLGSSIVCMETEGDTLEEKLQSIRDRLEDLTGRVAALEAQQSSAEQTTGEEPAYKKCRGESCKNINRRKFHHLLLKPQDPNNPVHLIKCSKGKCRRIHHITHGGRQKHGGHGRRRHR